MKKECDYTVVYNVSMPRNDYISWLSCYTGHGTITCIIAVYEMLYIIMTVVFVNNKYILIPSHNTVL